MSGSFDIESLGVFQVFTGGGTGTGFLVAPDRLLTNCHVVEPYRLVAVELRDKRRVVGKVRRIDPKRDLAVVDLAATIDAEILPLAQDAELEAKQSVNIIGFPIGLPLSLTEGVVSNPQQLFDGQRFVQTDAAINPGNSGGPILDDQRRIVAVTTCRVRSAESVGFGVPASDVRQFLDGLESQAAEFGVQCPSCDELLETAERYCENCGSDLEGLELEGFFEPPEEHPVVTFVEQALARADVDPVLARHGAQNWSFHSRSAPIKIWCCCSEHLCFSSPLARPGKKNLGELFRFLLSAEHEPLVFDLDENVIGLNLTIHMSDVFSPREHDELSGWIARFLALADKYDNLLIEQYGCEPAPETQLTFLKEDMGR